MSNPKRSSRSQTDTVATFLSCSVRPQDRPLVDAFQLYVLEPLGFRCVTIGRNFSEPEQVDDSIRRLLNSVHCLIGIATTRLEVVDRDYPEQTLRLATPYLLQESSMAFQEEIPFLIMKTPDIELQGVTSRNLYLTIDNKLTPRHRPRFLDRKSLVISSLRSLRERAVQYRKTKFKEELVSTLGKASTFAVGGWAALRGLDWLTRPNCFGEFYYKDKECKKCDYKPKCKIEKARRKD